MLQTTTYRRLSPNGRPRNQLSGLTLTAIGGGFRVAKSELAGLVPKADDRLSDGTGAEWRVTGMRPGEVCGLTLEEIERVGSVWVYRPARHKTAHRRRERAIPIGPKGQAALVAVLLRDGRPPEDFGHVQPNYPDYRDARLVMADAYEEAGRIHDAELLRDVSKSVVLIGGCVVDPAVPLFSSAQARAEWSRAARSKRKSKVPPSQMNRRKAKPTRAPSTRSRPTGTRYGKRRTRPALRTGTRTNCATRSPPP